MTAARDVLPAHEELPVACETLVVRPAVLVDQILDEHDPARLAHHERPPARVTVRPELEDSPFAAAQLPSGMREHPEHPPRLQLREELLAIAERHERCLDGHVGFMGG